MDRRSYLKHTLALAGGLLIPAGVMSLVGRHGVSSSTELVGFDGKIMGTGYSVRLGSPPKQQSRADQFERPLGNTHSQSQVVNHIEDQHDDQELKSLAHRVHSTLQNVDRSMSTWRDTSELSLFNNSAEPGWQSISPDTLMVIDTALHVSQLSHGAFDVSVGPLVNLWGFGPSPSNSTSAFVYEKPSKAAITDSMRYVGYHAIEIDHTQGVARKRSPKAKLDLSGIAKGFAVDKVAQCLDTLGYENYLVEVGGELRARGHRSNGHDWRVAIERPNSPANDVLRVLNLNTSAIATSGDYRNFYINGGERFSHSIDPRTGRPVNHELVSVSVIANTTMQADALSTAMIIMGPDDAQAFAQQHQLAAHFVLKSVSGSLDEKFSPFFTHYLS